MYNSAHPNFESATKQLAAPLAAVDLEAFDANAEKLAQRAKGRPIRVVTKSVRCRYLLDRVLAKPGFSGLMCYSLAEALWLNESAFAIGSGEDLSLGKQDIVVAYPTLDHHAVIQLAKRDHARENISLTIDSVEHLDFLDSILGCDHPTIRICLEFDASWFPGSLLYVGARRSPLFHPAQLAKLAKEVLARPGFELVGVLSYEAQIAGVPDSLGNPFRRTVIRWMQKHSARELCQRRGAAIAAVRALADLEFINGGGTGSIESTRQDDAITEIAAGSGLLGSALFSKYSQFKPQAALQFALPVARRPAENIATLYAGGYVASGPAGQSRLPAPCFPQGLKLLNWEGAGEVQTPVRGDAVRQLKIGDRVWLQHAKAGELAEHFDSYQVIIGDHLDREAPTYRGERKNFG